MEKIAVILAVGVFGVAGLLWMLRKASVVSVRIDLERARTFQASAYRPMERLLAEEDFEFLRCQPGYHSSIEKKLRQERRAIFGQYLNALSRDFHSLRAAVRDLVLSSPEDQSALLGELARQDLRFRFGIVRVQARLLLHATHAGGVPADVQRLIEAAERLSSTLRALNSPVLAGASS